MKSINKTKTLGLILLLGASNLFADTTPSPASSKPGSIEEITASGISCPTGSSSDFLDEQDEISGVIFDAFQISNTPMEKRASCTLDLKVKGQAGYQVALSSFELQSSVNIAKNQKLKLEVSGKFAEARVMQLTQSTIINGPLNKLDSTAMFKVDFTRLAWSPCTTSHTYRLDVKAELQGIMNLAGNATINSLKNIKFLAKRC